MNVKETLEKHPRIMSEWHKGEDRIEVRLSRDGLGIAVCFFTLNSETLEFEPVGCMRFCATLDLNKRNVLRVVMNVEDLLLELNYHGFFYHQQLIKDSLKQCTNSSSRSSCSSEKNSPL